MTSFLTRRWLVIFGTLIVFVLLGFLLLQDPTERFLDATLFSSDNPLIISGLVILAFTLDVALPIPLSVINVTAGAVLGFLGGTLVAWTGMTLGAMVGYWIGATGGTSFFRKLLGKNDFARAEAASERLALGSVLIMRAVPVLAEVSTIAAGISALPFWKFLSVVALANLGLSAMYAFIGAFSIGVDSFLLAIVASLALPLAAVGGNALYRQLVDGRKSANSDRVDAIKQENIVIPQQQITIEQTFSVPFTYQVTFTQGLFHPENPTLVEALALREPEKRHKCLVFIDEGVIGAMPDLPEAILAYARAHEARMEIIDAPQAVPGGEAIKIDPKYGIAILDRIHETRIDRHSYVIAIGGGAMLDAVGLAAATAHRGVRLIRVPTTVLGQNDSGVGVKNAINLKGIKNYLGTFAPPWAVLNDHDFIRALPPRERRNGLAEAVKVALIRDPVFFQWLEENADRLAAFDAEAEQYMIRRCAELHMIQIAKGGDPFEMGSARPLDFGHWSAHKLESMTDHAVKHGEAVAIGIALDTRYSVLSGLLTEGEEMRVVALLERLGLPTFHDRLDEAGSNGQAEVINGLEDFREHLGGELTITLLTSLGQGREVHEIDSSMMAEAMTWLRARSKG